MTLTNFVVYKLNPEEVKLLRKDWADKDFIPTGEYWLANFEMDGLKRQAGVRRGRRIDVAEDMDMFDVQLRVNQEELDEDSPLLPEAKVAIIVRLVGEEFTNGQYWKRPYCPTHKVALVPAVFRATPDSMLQGATGGFQCPAPDCKIKQSDSIAGDAGGFFTLNAEGKPMPWS